MTEVDAVNAVNAERVEVQLTAAVAELRRRESLRRRLTAADRQLGIAEERATRTALALDPRPGRSGGTHAALETLSLPRLLASLRGSRATALDRRRAVRKRAEYSHAVVVASRDTVASDRQELRRELAATDGAEDRYSAAVQARAAWLSACHDDERARTLAVTAHRRGRLEALETETRHAAERGREALAALGAARQAVSSKNSWASVDVFTGGGILADSSRRNRMDQAGRQLHTAEMALHRFVRELPETDLSIGALELNLTMTVLDVVFDNIFTDHAVQVHIHARGDGECRVQQVVLRKLAELENQLTLIRFERHTLDERRTGLLAALPRKQCA
jgi:hypothetical protein